MIRLTRRNFVKTGAVAASFTLPHTRLMAAMSPALFIFDSSLPESVRAAQGAGSALLDIAAQRPDAMRQLRAKLPDGIIAGLTRWSDYVLVRGYAEEQGKRIQSERSRAGLIEWQMG
jgi:hypothetical protein